MSVSPNFNATTPAAPAGKKNVIWQADAQSPADVSAYVDDDSVVDIGITIDGGGGIPSTGSKGFRPISFSCTIVAWTLLGDVSGNAQITIKKSTYAAFPVTASIVAAAPPNLTATQKNTSSTLTGWTTNITAGDVLEYNLDSVGTCTRLVLTLKVQRT